jgi:predicted RND superfamily exporter protein/CRP-like cAMP-binding protein
MLPRIEKLILEHPVLVIITSLIITALFGYSVPKIGFSSSSEGFFIQGDPDKVYFEKSKKLFGNDQVVVIAVVAPQEQTIYTKERLSRLDRLTRKIEGVDGVLAVVSLSNVPTIRAPLDPRTDQYQKAIEVKQLIKKIPETENEWQKFKKEMERIPLYQGNLVSQDRRAAAILVFIQDFKDSSRYEQVMKAIKAIIQKEQSQDNIYIAGVPETSVEMTKRMVADLRLLVPFTILFILIVLTLSFRQLRGIILPLVTIAMTTLWTVGFMELVDISITMVTMILPPLMLAIGSSYSIHMMSEYIAEVSPQATVREIVEHCINRIAFPIVICGFTTMVGFGSLVLNRIPTIRELGIAAVAGIFFAVLIAIFVVPASLMLIKKPKRLERKKPESGILNFMLDRIARLNIRHGKAIFYTAGIMVVASWFGIYHIQIDTDFLSFFPESDPVRKAVREQTRHLAGAAPFNIVLETDRPDVFKHPAMLKRLEALQQWAEQEVEGIDTTISIVDYVKILNQAFHQNDPSYYKIPDTMQEVSQILFMYSTSGSPEDMAPFFTTDYSTVNVLIRSRLVGSTKTNQAIHRIEEKAQELFKRPERETEKPGAVMTPVLIREREKEEEEDEEDIFWEESTGDEKTDESESLGDKEEDVILWEDEGRDIEEPLKEGNPEVENSGDALEAESGENSGQDEDTFFSPEEENVREDAFPEEDKESPEAEEYLGLPVPSEEDFPWPQVDVHMTGTIYLMNKSAVAVSRSQIIGLGTVLLAIFLIMSLLFLSTKIGFLAMLPNIFPIFMLFGLMGYSGITLNFSTSLIAAIALGIGVDDTIQYINRFNLEAHTTMDQSTAMINAIKSMGKPMIYTSVALFFGFIILTSSKFVPIRQFGMLTAITLMVALCSDLIILPTIMIRTRIITLWDLVSLEIGENPAQYIKIFHGLSNHQARVAVLMGNVIEYQDGDMIVREGETGRDMFVILKGSVDVLKGEGDKQSFIVTIGPGDAFGEMALLRKGFRSASVRAKGDVKLFVLNEETLERLQKRYPRVSSRIFYNITQLLSDRLQKTTEQLMESTEQGIYLVSLLTENQ